MRVDCIACGPAANESERLAIATLESKLRSTAGDDDWVLLTNLTFSYNHQRQSDEIDIVAVGPPGVCVIEVKHWGADWVAGNLDVAEREAEKAVAKARRVGTTLRNRLPSLPHVDAAMLLTAVSSREKLSSPNPLRGVSFCALKDWRDLVGLDKPTCLSSDDVGALARFLTPGGLCLAGDDPSRIAGYTNLQRVQPDEAPFHRIYSTHHPRSRDKVLLHLYDLSAPGKGSSLARAERECEALRRLQRFPWAPRIRDSLQEHPDRQGEMYFFTIIDPLAPSIGKRSRDGKWGTTERLLLARGAVRALAELHSEGEAGKPMLHRNLTPENVCVRYDNTPILKGLGFSRIPDVESVASAAPPEGKWTSTVAPEVRAGGLGASDCRSDIYSMCTSLSVLFRSAQDPAGSDAAEILKLGMSEDPAGRANLEELVSEFSQLLGESAPPPAPLPARYWTEDQEIVFNKYRYRIVSQLGAGGIGMAFKVIEIDKSTDTEMGSYVGKVVLKEEEYKRVRNAYRLARSHVSGHPGLSAIHEVASEWSDDNFAVLMKWVEGDPIAEYAGVFPILKEELQLDDPSPEALALRWLRESCEALSVLHRHGLVHGDVSPRNIICSDGSMVLTDYDFVTKIGEERASGTVIYSAPVRKPNLASAGDDVYALAATFFHVVFGLEPFRYEGDLAKERGLNWPGSSRDEYPDLAEFLDRSTSPDIGKRFASASEALEWLSASVNEKAPVPEEVAKPPAASETEISVEERAEKVAWLTNLLQAYPGSRWGNQETRGLDTEFAENTYVETELERTLLRDIRARTVRLVVLCGNAGDGKTALLQHLASRLGLGHHKSSDRVLEGCTQDGLTVRMNLDGAASWKDQSADEILDGFLGPFQQGLPTEDVCHLLAINDGRLLEWVEAAEARGGATPLTESLVRLLQEDDLPTDSHIRFVNLNQRSLVGGITEDHSAIETEFLARLIEHLYGGDRAATIWKPCLTCQSRNLCQAHCALQVFGPDSLPHPEPIDIGVRQHARKRLYEALQAVHLRGAAHITMRELRAALVYILFGLDSCRDYHNMQEPPSPYWDRAFDPLSPARQGELLGELARFDPALEAHPRLDRHLWRSADPRDRDRENGQKSLRRRAYFEMTNAKMEEVAGATDMLGLARGRHIEWFRSIPLDGEKMGEAGRAELRNRICRGISRLEDLPALATARPGVALRITPRTPTETEFWVDKPLDSFRLEADLPKTPLGIERLHRQASLVYRFAGGHEERLWMGADLFHLLLDLADGYQLGDVASHDTFANLSIFVQRLIREDERRLLAWNPMEDEVIFEVAAHVESTGDGPRQVLSLTRQMEGAQS